MWVIPVRFIPCYVSFTVLWSLYMFLCTTFIDAVRAIFTPEAYCEGVGVLPDFTRLYEESELFIAVVAKMLTA